MNRFVFILPLMGILMASAPVYAQDVEAVPLSAPSYTLSKETDPMAMDPGTVGPADEKVLHKGEALPATPPPGVDDQPGTSYDPAPPIPVTPPTDFAPAAPVMDSERTQQNYPNNSVSGVVKTDEKKFENRVFCTLKVSFTSIGTGIDNKTAEKVKTYLDANADQLTYKRADWGREGEYDYCIDIPTHNARAKIYTGLKRLLPPKDSKDQRTVLSGKGFTRVENSM